MKFTRFISWIALGALAGAAAADLRAPEDALPVWQLDTGG